MAEVLKGANITAQWYEDTYLGSLFSFLEKFVLHTTETVGWPGYGGGASAPNATYHPRLRQIRQHFSNNRSARALRDPSGTAVRENRDRVFQLEIVCYSDKRLGDSVGGLWVGNLTDSHFTDIAWMCIQLAQDLDLPLRQSVSWKEGATSFYSGVRLSGPSYDAYQGILGHIHVSGNSHWDPGGFFISRLMAKITQLLQGDDEMAIEAKLDGLIEAERLRYISATGRYQHIVGLLKADPIDEAQLADELAPLLIPHLPTVLARLDAEGLAEVAAAVADVQHQRMQS